MISPYTPSSAYMPGRYPSAMQPMQSMPPAAPSWNTMPPVMNPPSYPTTYSMPMYSTYSNYGPRPGMPPMGYPQPYYIPVPVAAPITAKPAVEAPKVEDSSSPQEAKSTETVTKKETIEVKKETTLSEEEKMGKAIGDKIAEILRENPELKDAVKKIDLDHLDKTTVMLQLKVKIHESAVAKRAISSSFFRRHFVSIMPDSIEPEFKKLMDWLSIPPTDEEKAQATPIVAKPVVKHTPVRVAEDKPTREVIAKKPLATHHLESDVANDNDLNFDDLEEPPPPPRIVRKAAPPHRHSYPTANSHSGFSEVA